MNDCLFFIFAINNNILSDYTVNNVSWRPFWSKAHPGEQ